MLCTSEQAKTKLCIHKRQITPDGKCCGEECMAWKPHYILEPLPANEIDRSDMTKSRFKSISTNEGSCSFMPK